MYPNERLVYSPGDYVQPVGGRLGADELTVHAEIGGYSALLHTVQYSTVRIAICMRGSKAISMDSDEYER